MVSMSADYLETFVDEVRRGDRGPGDPAYAATEVVRCQVQPV